MSFVDSPDYEFIAYIDESGDPGLKRVRPIDKVGGTEWLTISAILVRREKDHKISNWVSEINKDLGESNTQIIKFTELNSDKKLRAAKLLSALPIRIFVVASNKKNMRGYRNKNAEKVDSRQWFYNWIVRVLVERVTDFCFRYAERNNLQRKHVKFVFSQTGGHSYSQTAAYHELIKTQSRGGSIFLNKWTPRWEVMHYKLVEHYPHFKRAGLQLADVAASAVYHGVDCLDTGPCAPEYAIAMREKIAMNKFGHRHDYGLVLQPSQYWKAKLTKNQMELFQFYGYNFR